MICTYCGAPRADVDAYCAQCGKPFPAAQRRPATGTEAHLAGSATASFSGPASSTAGSGSSQGRGSKALVAAVVALALAVLAGTAVVVVNMRRDQPRSIPSAVAATTARSSPTTTTPVVTATTVPTFPALYRQVSDGVVRIETTACNGGGVGSGFLIAPDLVATVAHVVDGAVSVVVRQGETFTTGTVIGIDTHAELALVRTHIPLTGHVFTLDNSQPDVGTDVAAIGYPLGGPESLTKGSISGLGRTIDVGNGPMDGLIQTDTALNHGNSGGPLLTVDGAVVGFVEALSGEPGANGIAYAVPAQSAAASLQRWRETPAPVYAIDTCGAPTGNADIHVAVQDQSAHPDGPGIAAMFAAYANGINTGDYVTGYAQLSPHAQSLTSFDSFRGGEASSYIVNLSIIAVTVTDAAAGKDNAQVEFTSVQDPVAGGTGQACSNWKVTYSLISSAGGWLIDTARPHPGSPAAC